MDQFGLLAGIFGPIWTIGRYFWTNLDYWPVYLDQFGLLAGIFEVWIVLASIFVKIWTSPISKVGWYFFGENGLLAVIFGPIWTSSGRYLAVKF